MRKIINTLILIFFSTSLFAANDATKALEGVCKKITSAKSLTAAYSLSGQNNTSACGTITLSGDKFKLTSGDMTVWYDGKTQWTLLPQQGEVNISEPSNEELSQINPFILISNFKKNYNASTLQKNKTTHKILLKSKIANAQILKAEIAISANQLPESVKLTLVNGQTINIKISKITLASQLPLSTFRFPQQKYPKIEIVDLR